MTEPNTSTMSYVPKTRLQVVRTRIWRSRYIYLMILPVVLYFAIIHYWAMGWLSIAFYDYRLLRGFAGSEFVGFQNFLDFMKGINFVPVVRNTVLLNLYSLVFSFPMPIIFAILLNELRSMKFKRVVQTVSYLPHFLSAVVIVSMMTVIMSPSTGFINGMLKAVGLDTIYFMGESGWFRPIYIMSGIWQELGWSAIIYISALSGINPDLYEAARVDGAGRFRQIWHVSLPGIKVTIMLLLILRIGNLMGSSFEKPFLMQNDLNNSVAEVLATYTYKVGLVRGSYSLSTAIGLFNSIISLILVTSANAISRKVSEISLF
jgi:putative aldouronate transport system permease protein